MKDDFFEERFDPKYKTLFEKKLNEFGEILQSNKKQPAEYTISFIGEFDSKSKKAIAKLINDIVQFSIQFDLILNNYNHEIEFYTLSSWNSSTNYSEEIQNLPATKLKLQHEKKIIQMIVPDQIESGSIVINVVRLLSSKFFGKMYFDQFVPNRPPFSSLKDFQKKLSFSFEEKVSFIKTKGIFSKNLISVFEKTGRSFGIHGPQKTQVGKNEFFKTILSQQSSAKAKLISDDFATLTQDFQIDFERFFENNMEHFFSFQAQTNAILPHEMPRLNTIKKNDKTIYLSQLEDRVGFIIHYIEEVLNVKKSFFSNEFEKKETTKEEIKDQLSIIKSTSRQRMKELKQGGLVKLFLLQTNSLTDKEKRDLQLFPLWIFNHVLKEQTHLKGKKENLVKKITSQYTNSVHQKLFEASFRINRFIDEFNQKEIHFEESAHYNRLKSLFAWFEFRLETLKELHSFLKVLKQFSKKSNSKLVQLSRMMNHYEQGWSYFISFALIHQYYLKLQQKKKSLENKAVRYEQIIEGFIDEKMKNIVSYRFSALLFLLYKSSGFRFETIIPLIKDSNRTIDFYLRQSDEIFQNKEACWETANKYAQMILKMHQNEEVTVSFDRKATDVIDLN